MHVRYGIIVWGKHIDIFIMKALEHFILIQPFKLLTAGTCVRNSALSDVAYAAAQE